MIPAPIWSVSRSDQLTRAAPRLDRQARVLPISPMMVGIRLYSAMSRVCAVSGRPSFTFRYQ